MRPKMIVSVVVMFVACYVGFSEDIGRLVYSIDLPAIVTLPISVGLGVVAVGVFLWGLKK
jgi:hypothetical protein